MDGGKSQPLAHEFGHGHEEFIWAIGMNSYAQARLMGLDALRGLQANIR